MRISPWCVIAGVLALSGTAAAQPDPALTPEGPPGPPVETITDVDPTFGPMVIVEDIRVVGNRSTAERVILRALPFLQGERLRAADPRLANARFKLLALGFFRDVSLALEKGSSHGRVIVVVTVAERGTIQLNRLWYGSSQLTPWWIGADLNERNFAGTGLLLGGGLVYAANGGVDGASAQWGANLRLGAGGIAGTRWGASGSLMFRDGSEALRVSGPPGSSDNDDLSGFTYRRLGGRGTARFDLTSAVTFDASLRLERITTDLDPANLPSRMLPGGGAAPVPLYLAGPVSEALSMSVGVDLDTRDDPVLPRQGSRLQAQLEVGIEALGTEYTYAVGLARFERWFPIAPRHAVALRAAGGLVLGDAPRFDRIHIADVNRMLTPTIMGMTVAMAPPPDFLGTDNGDAVYGELGGNLIVEWSYRWFRRPRAVYGGDLFIAGGLWGLHTEDAVRRPGATGWDTVPVDLVIDAGLRIDTEVGIFEFTVANALGRVPRW